MLSPEKIPPPPAAPAGVDESPLRSPVGSVWGVGEERARLLARLEIFTVEDLLLHKPRRYEDRRKFLPIRDLKVKEPATVRGKIIAAGHPYDNTLREDNIAGRAGSAACFGCCTCARYWPSNVVTSLAV